MKTKRPNTVYQNADQRNINMVLMMRGKVSVLAITNHNVVERVYSSSESTGLGVPLGEFNWKDG